MGCVSVLNLRMEYRTLKISTVHMWISILLCWSFQGCFSLPAIFHCFDMSCLICISRLPLRPYDHISNYRENFPILTRYHNFDKNLHISNLFLYIRGPQVRKEREEKQEKKRQNSSCQTMPLVRIAQIVASWHSGREKMEREWENEEEMER